MSTGVDVLAYQPAWLTWEIQDALSRLPSAKHRATVLRLAESRVIGRSETETFKLADVCSRRTWYGRYRDGRHCPGWRDDELVQDALEAATKRALWWKDNEVARHIEKAHRRLAIAAPDAVVVLTELMRGAESEETRRKSANDILDRADVATAAKGSMELQGAVEFMDVSDDELEAIRAALRGDVSGGGEAG